MDIKKIKKFVKKHINLFVLIGVVLLCFLGIGMIKYIFFPTETKAIYGNRLDGRNKVKITEEDINKIKDLYKDSSKETTVRIQGRIIYVDINGNDDLSLEVAKGFGKIVDVLSDDKKAYYDIQIIVKNTANTAQFPIIGYKQHTRDAFNWTKDRG